MDPKIDDYIRENRARYTRESIREQLIAAGHDPTAIDLAWDHAEAPAVAARAPAGWRFGWASALALVVLGSVGAAIVWRNEQYSAGGIAAVIYAVIALIAIGVGVGISRLVDRGTTGAAVALLALIGGAGTLFLAANVFWLVADVAALGTACLIVMLLVLGRRGGAGAGWVGAAVPLIFWLVVTGTCYAPLIASGSAQPAARPATVDLRIEPPFEFAGSGAGECSVSTNGFEILSNELGTLAGSPIFVTIRTAPPSLAFLPPLGDRDMFVVISLPAGGGAAFYSPEDETFKLHAAPDGISGTLDFAGLVNPDSSQGEEMSGTLSWTCQ